MKPYKFSYVIEPKFILPAGRYVIGDPSRIMDGLEWSDLEITLSSGRRAIVSDQ